MKRDLRIATCGLPAMLGAALGVWIYESLDAHCTLTDFAGDAASSELDGQDIYITMPETFISRLDFFLPHKSRTALLLGTPADERTFPVLTISLSETPEIWLQKLTSLIPSDTETEEEGNTLTQRETDVLRQIAAGKTYKEIADCLNISVNTVLTHRKNITAKLGIRSASGLSLYALMNGLV